MTEVFYGASRSIVEFFIAKASAADKSSKDDMYFSDTVNENCKHLNFDYNQGNKSLIWEDVFYEKNKCVNLRYVFGHEDCP